MNFNRATDHFSILVAVTGVFSRQFNSPGGRGFEIGAEGRQMVGPCEIITGDWETVAGSHMFPPAAFDFVVAFDVLEHLPRIGEYTKSDPNGAARMPPR